MSFIAKLSSVKLRIRHYILRWKCLNNNVHYKTKPFIGGKCKFDAEIHLGNNCNFNGMEILGRGEVFIGDNFHSGKDCMMITENHNYEGSKIPYDHSFVKKKININENVWLGNRVIIVGNVTIGEGAIVAAGGG